MCRFLLVKSKSGTISKNLLLEFAVMCEKSRTPDGDRQGDGWGISWKNSQGNWEIYKSIKPVWEDTAKLELVPSSSVYVVHARSASHHFQKEILEYNQPYIEGKLSFVFNGRLRSVDISAEGQIGAQKLFSLLKQELLTVSVDKVLGNIQRLLKSHTRRIEGLNLGFVYAESLFALNYYERFAPYYTLYYYDDDTVSMVVSEPFRNYPFKKMDKGETLKL